MSRSNAENAPRSFGQRTRLHPRDTLTIRDANPINPSTHRMRSLEVVAVCLRLLATLGVMISFTACATSSFSESSDGQSRAERPVYAVGERWYRGDGTYELKRSEDDVYVFETSRGESEIRLTKELALARIRKGKGF